MRLKKTQDNKKKKKIEDAKEALKRKGKAGDADDGELVQEEDEEVIPSGQFDDDEDEDEDVFV